VSSHRAGETRGGGDAVVRARSSWHAAIASARRSVGAGGFIACILVAACDAGSGASNGSLFGTPPGVEDASPVDGQHGPDGGPWCPGPLGDAGFSSLSELPLESLCAQSAASGGGGVGESTIACQGFTLVVVSLGVEGCGSWWLFDATGALVAQGGGCIGDGPGCRAAVPGLQLPYQCFVNGGWPQKVSLCPDAGVDAGAPEAASDVLDEAD